MFENYFKLQEQKLNTEDLANLIFKKMIVDAYEDNQQQFDYNLLKLKSYKISLFNTFTIDSEYSGSINSDIDGNSVRIEKVDSDYSSFIQACGIFIDDEKYLIKIVKHLERDEVLKNMSDMTPFILNLLDRNKKETFFEIIKTNLLSEKEIKLNLILPERRYHFMNRESPFYKLEVDFLSENINELKVNKENERWFIEIVNHLLENMNNQQFKKFSNNVVKTDIGEMSDYQKKEIVKKLFEYGIVNENQLIGLKRINEKMSIPVKSFLGIGESVMKIIKELQAQHLSDRLGNIENKIQNKVTKI